MAEYINKNKVLEYLNEVGGCGSEPGTFHAGWDCAVDAAYKHISDMPAADVEPVKRGKWMETEWKGTYGGDFCVKACSNCKEYALIDVDDKFDYCPYCGAKMETPD